jgi:NAD-dependent SIR2 family protein deacetylase
MTESAEQSASDTLSEHVIDVVHWMTRRRVTPFLGAGVNLADRPPGVAYEEGKWLPNGGELARSLAEKFKYPFNDKDNLLRVSWYATFKQDQAALYDYLQDVFAPAFEPGCVHRFLATLPRELKAHNYPNCYQTIVTTNYDDVLERALEAQGEEYDVLYFQAEGENAGFFYHVPYKQEPRVIPNPQDYPDLPIDLGRGNTRTIIVKIHGALSRAASESSSFVVTEDDYIDYLARAKMQQPLPKVLEAELQKTRFLFMGYSLRDWNMRVFLRRIFQARTLTTKSWAIMHETEELEEYFWERNDVKVFKLSLKDYVAKLNSQIETLPKSK